MNQIQHIGMQQLVSQHWQFANARDWTAFANLLAEDLVYEVPQTRERVTGRAGYVDFFATSNPILFSRSRLTLASGIPACRR